jgi:hypothetical protein
MAKSNPLGLALRVPNAMRAFRLGAALMLALTGLHAVLPDRVEAATFTITPTSGPVGTTITVTGSGMQPNSRMWVSFQCLSSQGGGITVQVGNVGSMSGYQLTFAPTASDLQVQNGTPPGTWEVVVSEYVNDLRQGQPFVQRFTITGGAA